MVKCFYHWFRPEFTAIGDNKCYNCTYDPVNNPNCERYIPVKFYLYHISDKEAQNEKIKSFQSSTTVLSKMWWLYEFQYAEKPS